MLLPPRLYSRLWLLIPACALGFLTWTNYERGQRAAYVTNTDREDAVVDAASPTGYAGGKRWLIVPAHDNRSYQWIAETQQMLARREWRVRHVDYDNAPFGREVHASSLYRWWLGLIAWCDHAASGRPLGVSVERAALVADPVLQWLLLLGTTVFVARGFGSFPAALAAIGLAAIFPLAGGFLPGAPDDHGLGWALALGSVLPLLAAARGKSPAGAGSSSDTTAGAVASSHRRAVRLCFIAGVAGGAGLWVNAAGGLAVLLGIAMGGLVAAGMAPAAGERNLPWRAWAFGGAATCLAAYLIEYFPAHMAVRLQVNHPLYGLAWVGAGELLELMGSRSGRRKFTLGAGEALRLIGAIAAVASPAAAWALTRTQSLLTLDPLASQLTCLPNGVVAKNLPAWIARDGLTGTVAATCLPLVLLGPAAWLLTRRPTGRGRRTALAIGLGPVLVALGLACVQLRWWNLCDGLLLALVVAAAAAPSRRSGWLWSGLAGLAFLPGLFQLLPPAAAPGKIAFTPFEVQGLIERDLAHWVADHAGTDGAVILAPPDRTTSWCFYGGLRGLGSANWENRDGLEATVRIATAITASTALAFVRERGVTYIILPSWDADLDEFARWTLRNPEDAFITAIHHWALPPWLRPLPYKLPAVAGFEGESVVILKVTDESNRAASLGRLAEYFIEMQQLELAAAAGQGLQRYPADLGALVALAQIEKARGEAEDFARTFGVLLSSVAGGFDRTLAWDRRVSLAVVLAEGDRNDLAREQVRRCLEKVDETRLRSLTTASLFRLLALSKAFGLEISDLKLRELARKLLPAELRDRL